MLLNEIMVTMLLVLCVVGFYSELFAPQVAFIQIPQYAFPRTFLHLGRDCFIHFYTYETIFFLYN